MIHPIALRNGLIATGIVVAYTIVAYLVGVKLFTNWWIAIILMIGILVYYILSVKNIRKAKGGFISFGDAFVQFIVMSAMYIVISTLFMYILIWVIDPDFGQAYVDASLEKIIGMMEGFGAPDVAIEEAIAEAEVDFEKQKSLGGTVLNMLGPLGGFAIVGLIVAAVLKKNPPVFEETETID